MHAYRKLLLWRDPPDFFYVVHIVLPVPLGQVVDEPPREDDFLARIGRIGGRRH